MTFEEFVPSWRAKLQLPEFLEEKRPKFINVTFQGNAEAVSLRFPLPRPELREKRMLRSP